MIVDDTEITWVKIHTDQTGDVAEPTIDIIDTYENDNMSILNVTFADIPALYNSSDDDYRYFCYIDTDRDNYTWEYIVGIKIQSYLVTYIENRDSKRWNGTQWVNSTKKMLNCSYISGNSVIFNFSSCPECIGDNYYHIWTMYEAIMDRDIEHPDILNYYFFKGQQSGTDVFTPKINELYTTPTAVRQGENLNLIANVTDESGVSRVLANITTYDGMVLQSLELLDDGSHNDDLAGDGIYGNTWNTGSNPNGTYLIDFFCNDTLGNEYDDEGLRSFAIGPSYDTELLDGLYLQWYDPGTEYVFQEYKYLGHDYFEVSVDSTLKGKGKYQVNNATRIIHNSTMSYYQERYYSEYFIDPRVQLHDKVLIERRFKENMLLEVNGTDWFLLGDELYKCWCLENRSENIRGLYEFRSGILMFLGGISSGVRYRLNDTNYPFQSDAFEIVSPENKTYDGANIPLVLKDNSGLAVEAWGQYYYGGSWSEVINMTHNGTHWVGNFTETIANISDCEGSYLVRCVARLHLIEINFTRELMFEINLTQPSQEDGEPTTPSGIPGFTMYYAMVLIILMSLFIYLFNRGGKEIRYRQPSR
jgi:hypothetical protein